jgi:hypothetical protein
MMGNVESAVGSDAVAGGVAGPGAAGVVSRPRLFGRLAAPARVTMVSAPPGSGKTVLLRSWIGQAGVAGRTAWVPAGRGERDPQRQTAAACSCGRRPPSTARSASAPELTEAKGIIMAQSHCGEAQAFDLLRRASQRGNVPIRDLAAQIVAKTAQVSPKPSSRGGQMRGAALELTG